MVQRMASTPHKALTEKEVDDFVRNGFLVVRGAFPRAVAEEIVDLVWHEAPIDRHDRSTWTKARHTIEKTFVNDTTRRLYTDRIHHAFDDLLGEGRYPLSEQLGYSLINLPGFDAPPWSGKGWHVDGAHFQHHLHSKEQGLVGLFLFTDILPEGGGTAVRPGSHQIVASLLQKAGPEGLSCAELSGQAESATAHLPIREVTGEAGDMVVMHPLTYHGSSSNCSDRVRIASNICVPLHEEMNLRRENPDDYSPVEKAIIQALQG